jgi:hypothetical protein
MFVPLSTPSRGGGVAAIHLISIADATEILQHIIRMETVTRMDAELVNRSNQIHERLIQLGDSL